MIFIHVLRETTSRGQCELVCPSPRSVLLRWQSSGNEVRRGLAWLLCVYYCVCLLLFECELCVNFDVN